MRRGLVLAGAFWAAAAGALAQGPGKAAAEAVATVDGVAITVAEVEKQLGNRLAQLRTQEFNLRRQGVEELLAQRLLEREAAARKLSLPELSAQEIDAKVAPVTEQEQKDFYASNKSRFGATAEADALRQIADGLKRQRTERRRQEFVQELRKKAKVAVLLEPPRVKVDAGDDPVKGPDSAPVTIVEFSDFQCPYCARVPAVLKQIAQNYGDKVKVVFRDFPLLAIHPQAAKAAEAGACAFDQGKFWEMHDKLFENQGALQVADLKKRAEELGLDAAAFAECLDSGRKAAEWQGDLKEGEAYGVQSTPSFFVNGRAVVGAQPYEAFAQIIEDELGLLAARTRPGSR
jgi:protein-disulfide isomerase